MLRLVPLILALAACSYAEAATPCPILNARYSLRDDPKFVAGFFGLPAKLRGKTDVGFYIRSRHKHHTYWLMFDRPSATTVNLKWLYGDPLKSGWKLAAPDAPQAVDLYMTYLAADRTYRFFTPDLPTARQAAPQYILLPDLPEAMWYWPDDPYREGAPLSFFALTRCERPRGGAGG